MRFNLRRAGAIGLAAAAVSGLVVAGAGPANAATTGTLTGAPVTGSVTYNPFSVITSALCPDTTAYISGVVNNAAAGWEDVTLFTTSDTELRNLTTSGMPSADTILSIATSHSPVLAVPNGTYTIRVDCLDGILFPTILGSFVGSFTVAGDTYTFNSAAVPASTTTLAVTPASPQTAGTAITLKASVTSTAAVAGTVQFKDGSTNLGSPVPVTAGAASLPTSALTAGNHSLTAQFIPTSATSIVGSTSAAVPFVINAVAADPVATTTTLSSSPSAPTTADVVSLTATVAPANAAGTLTFKEGSTTVGSATVNGGSGSVSLTGLTAGTHSYTATFTPTNAVDFLTSTAAATTVTVTTFSGASAKETITTSVAAGTLVITAGGSTVDLGSLALNPSNNQLVSVTKDINPVTVTDTRAGNLGWNVNGSAGDFTNAAGDKIGGQYLGWTPKVISQESVQNVTAGGVVVPGAGLTAAHLLGSAPAGSSLGTAQLGAGLVLQAPTSTKPGTYNTTLTLTAI